MFRNKRQQTCLLPHYALLCYTIYAMLCLCKCARIRADINTQICHETCICSHFASASSISTTQKNPLALTLSSSRLQPPILRWDLLCSLQALSNKKIIDGTSCVRIKSDDLRLCRQCPLTSQSFRHVIFPTYLTLKQ